MNAKKQNTIQIEKNKHNIYNPTKYNLAQIIKIAIEKQRSSGEAKKILTSKGLFNSDCNLLTSEVERKQFKIYLKKLNQWVLNPKGDN